MGLAMISDTLSVTLYEAVISLKELNIHAMFKADDIHLKEKMVKALQTQLTIESFSAF